MNNEQPLRIICHCDSFFNNHLIGGEGWGKVQFNKQLVSQVKELSPLWPFPYIDSFSQCHKTLLKKHIIHLLFSLLGNTLKTENCALFRKTNSGT